MKANELMIGDWVEVIQNGNPAYAQIQMIDGYGDNATYNECICDGIYYNINEIKPIPLTTEILEKNGFKFDGEFYKLGDYQLVIEYRGGFLFGWVFCHRKQLKYVHELQHALHQCEIEKEIEL